APASRRC
ncbi:ABC transporter related, partial [Microbacterium sp. HM58-2]